ncbi:hypothetical protein KSP35_07315 [Aquihabitans sp. G128]|uniref:hypothetical protein n=1 Tax=Aquihabitans sp. G128 TaxID=2849779 RepID=UPI001C225082|nr:hypothetical protein [Aquihabitans sp. G128]QXC62596.1 hypothetical protein KSP35_07315 [Aquihabitans sp. G128]
MTRRARPPRPAARCRPASTSSASGAIPGSSDSSAAPSGGSSATTAAAFSPTALAPPGGVQVPPTTAGANLEWKLTGTTWQAVLARYQDAFPIAGYQLGRLSTTFGGPGGKGGEGHEIVPKGGSDGDGVGELDVHVGDDAGTIVLVSYSAAP